MLSFIIMILLVSRLFPFFVMGPGLFFLPFILGGMILRRPRRGPRYGRGYGPGNGYGSGEFDHSFGGRDGWRR